MELIEAGTVRLTDLIPGVGVVTFVEPRENGAAVEIGHAWVGSTHITLPADCPIWVERGNGRAA